MMRTIAFLSICAATTLLFDASVFAAGSTAGSPVSKAPGQTPTTTPAPTQQQPTPASALSVHLTTAPTMLSDAYVQAEDQVRQDSEGTWLPLVNTTGSLQPSWWRHRLTWNMQGARLDVNEELNYRLAYRAGAGGTGTADTTIHRCGVAPPKDAPGVAQLQHHATLFLTQQYQPTVGTQQVEWAWPTRCALTAVTGDVTPTLVAAFAQERQRLTTLVVGTLTERWPIRTRLESVWRTLHEPILVDEPSQTWVLLSPQATQAGGLGLRASGLMATVAIEVRPTIVRGQAPTVTAAALPLSREPGRADLPTPHIRTTFDLLVPFQEADDRIREALVGQSFSGVRILSTTFTPVGDRGQVDLDLDMAGLATLRMQVTGIPVFDERSQTVSFTRVDYAIKNRSAMSDLAESLLHDEFRHQLERRLTFLLTPRLNDARRAANEALIREWKGGRVDGQVHDLRMRRFSMERNGFQTSLFVDAEIHYTIPTIPTAPPTPAVPTAPK
ncbi:MAG: DUF4403 family protein [Nitrospiraceae bacterium]